MSKRILSICLAVLIMVMALPVTLIAPLTASAATEEINLSALNFPTRVIDRVMHNFDDATDANIGQANYSNPQGFVYTSTGDTAFSFENGAAKLSISADSKQPYNYFYFNCHQGPNTPTANTKYLSVHVDFTGVTSLAAGTSIGFRTALGGSSGQNSVNTNYGQCGVTYYYISDTTGVVETKATGGSSVWNAQIYGKAGEAGTFIIPIEMWSGTAGENNIAFDISEVLGGYRVTGSTYATNRIQIDYRTQLGNGDYIYYDDFEWLADNPLSGVYTTQLMAEDFSDTESVSLGYWSNNPENWATIGVNTDGKLAVTAGDTVAWGSRQTVVVENLKAWGQNATAFAYDVDLSAITGHGLTLYHRFYESGSDGSVSFAPWGNTVYLYGTDGKLTTVTADTTAWNAGVAFPEGFKGTVIIPVESMRASAADTEFSSDLYLTNNLALEIETKGYGTEADPDIDAGKVSYYDNFAWYVEPITPEEGTTFSATENSSMNIKSVIIEPVKTVEMWVKTSATTDGTILNKKFRGNGASATSYNLNVAINAAGNPVYNIADGHGNYAACTFSDVVVNTGNWTHIAFVQKAESIDLYVNSALAQSIAATDFNVVVNGNLTVGHVFGNAVTGKTDYFDGEISELRMWSTVRTPAELYYNAATAPVDTNGLIARWALYGDEPFANSIATSDYDIVEYDYEISADDEAYATYSAAAADDEYSIVFLPDTQIVNRHYKEDFPGIYDWIIENKDKYNIEAVMSLGDITDKNDDDLTLEGIVDENGDGEWGRAAKQFDRLTDAGIPWTIIPGNHDCAGASVGSRNYANLNAAFPYSKISQFSYFGGSFKTSTVVNSYYYLTMGGTKYLLLCLDQEPRADSRRWAEQVIQNHPDYRVIVTTHIYMTSQGVYYDAESAYTGFEAEDFFTNVLGKYSNVDMVVCGHSSTPNILTRKDIGTSGHEVLQVIVDTQQIDYTYGSASCVAIATFSDGGDTVRWNLYSTAQDLYLDEDSQFTTTLDSEVGEAVTEYASAESVFNNPTVLRDFTTLNTVLSDSSYAYKSAHLNVGNAVSSQSIDTFTLEDCISVENRKLNVKLPANGDSATVTAGLSFQALPTVIAEDEAEGIAVYLDASASTAKNQLRITYYSGNGTNWAYKNGSTKFYTIADDGTMKTVTAGTNVVFPAGFKGWIVMPFDNTVSAGTLTSEQAISDSRTNTASLTFQFWSASADTTYYIDNLCYVKGLPANEIDEASKSITITDSIAIDYKLDGDAIESAGYTDVYAEYTTNGVTTTLKDYEVDEDGNYVFNFKGINPKNVADTITATYYGVKNGATYITGEKTYSVAQYCYNIINNGAGNSEYEDAIEVCKGLLNFAAAAQEYFEHNVENLANSNLDDQDKVISPNAVENKTKLEALDGATASWYGAGLNLKTNVSLYFMIYTEDVENTRVVIKTADGHKWVVLNEYFEAVEGYDNYYYVYFNKLGAAAMRDEITAVICDLDNNPLSATLNYSIESYAASAWNSEDTLLQKIVKAMMCYGDAASNYSASNAE